MVESGKIKRRVKLYPQITNEINKMEEEELDLYQDLIDFVEEESLKEFTPDDSISYKFCDDDLLEYSLKGVASLR